MERLTHLKQIIKVVYNHLKQIIKKSFMWIFINIIVIILPTGLAFLYETLSTAKLPDLIKYYDSIILILFSVACNLLTVCHDKRSGSIKKGFTTFINGFSRCFIIFYGGFHFYIVGNNKYVVNNYFLIFSLIILILFGIFGSIFANHHAIYDIFIEYIQSKMNKQNSNNSQNGIT